MIYSLKITGKDSLIIDNSGFFMTLSTEKKLNRPCIDFGYDYGFRFIMFGPRIHNWFKEMNIEYSIRYDEGVIIDFNNRESAMLYKLVWG